MRHHLPLVALLLAGCPPAASGPAAPASVAPVVTGVLYADGPEVTAAFSPELQATLLEGDLEVAMIVCERPPEPGERTIRGYPFVTSVTLTDKAKRAELLAEVYWGVEHGRGAARCFSPHHALVAEHDGHLAEVVICFQCVQLEVYLDGTKMGDNAAIHPKAEKAFVALLGPIRDPLSAGR